ncbi:hypothetical protein AAFF_G00223360, partial [Aldrovandia affinis]
MNPMAQLYYKKCPAHTPSSENLEVMELLLNHSVYVGTPCFTPYARRWWGQSELLLSHRRPSGEN